MGVSGIGPGGLFQQPPPDVMRENVMPSVPYYDLPAGLMVPLVAVGFFKNKFEINCLRHLSVLV